MMLRNFLKVLAATLQPFVACAGDIAPVELPAITHETAHLTVVGPDAAEGIYTPADLEAFETYQMSTTSPWRDEVTIFQGILLRDLLRANGLEDAPAIRVTAENDYMTTIPRAVWDSLDIMVVTRIDGQPHTRRARGPIQFMIDADSYAASGIARESHLVWMAARIEPADEM